MKATVLFFSLLFLSLGFTSCNQDELERYKRLAKQQEMIADLNARKAIEYEKVARMEIDACYRESEKLRERIKELQEALEKCLDVQREMKGIPKPKKK